MLLGDLDTCINLLHNLRDAMEDRQGDAARIERLRTVARLAHIVRRESVLTPAVGALARAIDALEASDLDGSEDG